MLGTYAATRGKYTVKSTWFHKIQYMVTADYYLVPVVGDEYADLRQNRTIYVTIG